MKRTDGVSTTDLIERMLRPDNFTHFSGLKHSMMTSKRIADFSAGCRAPTEKDTVVYIDGNFDLFRKIKIINT